MVVTANETSDFFGAEDLEVQTLESTDEFCVGLKTETASKLKGAGMDTCVPKRGGNLRGKSAILWSRQTFPCCWF